jgi:hypothetical protein
MLHKAPFRSVRNNKNNINASETVSMSYLRFVGKVYGNNQAGTNKPALILNIGADVLILWISALHRCISFVATCASQIFV